MKPNSYSKIYALGSKQISKLWGRNVIVEEKVDGSQISFMREGDQLFIRSKEAHIPVDNPTKPFGPAVEAIKAVKDKLDEGFIYRGEYLSKPRHNVHAYGRIPKNHIMIFDIQGLPGMFENPGGFITSRKVRESEVSKLGFEIVPFLGEGLLTNIGHLEELLETPSVLGEQKVEGLVIKPIRYDLYDEEGKLLMGKLVSPAFREKHGVASGISDGKGPMVNQVIAMLKTEARWNKAVQHLRDKGMLTESPKDIGLIMGEVKRDLLEEEGEWLKERIFHEFIRDVTRGVTAGLPEWYKQKLLENLGNS